MPSEPDKPKNTGSAGHHWNLDGKRPGGDLERLLEGKKQQAEQDQRIEAAAQQDRPLDLYRELQAQSAKAALRLYKKYNATGKVDPRLTEVSREARQLTDRLIELIAAEGAASQADSFFAEVFGRVEQIAPTLAELAEPLATPGS